MIRQTINEWLKQGVTLFGDDMKAWRFKCAKCGETQTIQDFIDAGVENPERYVHFSCIGRWVKDRGCNWTLGGLFQFHKKEVINDEGARVQAFLFDGEEAKESEVQP